MPSVLIEVMKEYSQNEVAQILKSVREGIESAFAISSEHTYLRIINHNPKHCSLPSANLSAHQDVNDFIHITIDCYPGRTIEKKKSLFENVSTLLKQQGIDENHIFIVIRENPPENWKTAKID